MESLREKSIEEVKDKIEEKEIMHEKTSDKDQTSKLLKTTTEIKPQDEKTVAREEMVDLKPVKRNKEDTAEQKKEEPVLKPVQKKPMVKDTPSKESVQLKPVIKQKSNDTSEELEIKRGLESNKMEESRVEDRKLHEKKGKLEKSPEGKKPAGIKEVAISKTTDDSKIEKTQTKPKTLSNNDISENKTREKEAKKEKEQQKESKEIEKIKEENEPTVLKKATPAKEETADETQIIDEFNKVTKEAKSESTDRKSLKQDMEETQANNISPNVPKQKVEESKKTKTNEYESKTLERQASNNEKVKPVDRDNHEENILKQEEPRKKLSHSISREDEKIHNKQPDNQRKVIDNARELQKEVIKKEDNSHIQVDEKEIENNSQKPKIVKKKKKKVKSDSEVETMQFVDEDGVKQSESDAMITEQKYTVQEPESPAEPLYESKVPNQDYAQRNIEVREISPEGNEGPKSWPIGEKTQDDLTPSIIEPKQKDEDNRIDIQLKHVEKSTKENIPEIILTEEVELKPTPKEAPRTTDQSTESVKLKQTKHTSTHDTNKPRVERESDGEVFDAIWLT